MLRRWLFLGTVRLPLRSTMNSIFTNLCSYVTWYLNKLIQISLFSVESRGRKIGCIVSKACIYLLDLLSCWPTYLFHNEFPRSQQHKYTYNCLQHRYRSLRFGKDCCYTHQYLLRKKSEFRPRVTNHVLIDWSDHTFSFKITAYLKLFSCWFTAKTAKWDRCDFGGVLACYILACYIRSSICQSSLLSLLLASGCYCHSWVSNELADFFGKIPFIFACFCGQYIYIFISL